MDADVKFDELYEAAKKKEERRHARGEGDDGEEEDEEEGEEKEEEPAEESPDISPMGSEYDFLLRRQQSLQLRPDSSHDSNADETELDPQ